MNYEKVHQKAEDFLRIYNPTGLIPFPFEDVVQKCGDIDFLALDNSNEAVSGAIYYQNDRVKILINPKRPAVRQYFTMAHEFGHYYLHKDWLQAHKEDGFVDFVDYLDSGSRLFKHDVPVLTDKDAIIREREANNFAAAILMPEDNVRRLWDVSPDIERCAEIFQVSNSAMAIRLERLGLFA